MVPSITPLLEPVARDNGKAEISSSSSSGNWWRKILDWEETKNQILFSLPMILINLCFYAIPLVSVMFAGHLGKLELAGSTLANSWASVTGLTFMTGLSGALETLCGQGFGANQYRMLGIYLQGSCIISLFFSFIISIIWFFTEPILILLQQQPNIAKAAGIYMKCLIPGLFAYGILQNIIRFIQTQSVVTPLIFFSLVPMGIHFGIVYVFVYCTSLGYAGASLAASVSLWIAVLMLGSYVLFSTRFQHTWEGFSSESFSFIITNFRLALPSAAMVCLEYWAFEFLVLLAGLMPNSEVTTSLIAMCVNTEAIAYMITYGLSAAASTRVSNELGAGNVDRAKSAMAVTIKLSILLALVFILALVFGHNIWAGFFSNSTVIIKQFASFTPLLAISVTLDSIQGVLSGVARGTGWQHLAVWANLATFFCLGMPIAVLLGFKLKLYAKGLWIGLICGLSVQATALFLITTCRNWSKLDIPVSREREIPVSV